jgi:hypothetical protein
MAGSNGTNGHVEATGGIDAVLKLPTIDELRRAYEEGIPQRLFSGVEVVMRPVRLDRLLMSGNVPDILTPLVMKGLFPAGDDEAQRFPDEVNHFIGQKRDKQKEAVDFIRAVDVVCEAALVDVSVLPYLPLSDRLWIFRLAFLPAEVLSRFRLQPQTDVADVGEGDEVRQAAE